MSADNRIWFTRIKSHLTRYFSLVNFIFFSVGAAIGYIYANGNFNISLKETIEYLVKLGFNFWQIIVLFIIIVFRKNISFFIENISLIKKGDTEIRLNQKEDVVGALTEIKDGLPKNKTVDIEELLDSQIEKRIIDALISLKMNTIFLWPDLKGRATDRFVTPIKSRVLMKVVNDLNLLRNAKYIEYSQISREGIAGDGDIVLKLEVNVINDKLDEYIAKAEKLPI